MRKSNSVVVVGSTNWDICMYLSHLPAPGETVGNGRLQGNIGGKGANQAVACQRAGAEVHFVSALGDDQTGRGIRQEFKQMGLDVSSIEVIPHSTTGTACIFIDANAENCIGLTAGANAYLSTEIVDQYKPLITNAGVVLLQLEIPFETVMHVAQLAQQAGTTVVLNPAPAQALPDKLLAMVDILTPNRGEAGILAGLETDTDEGLEAAARSLLHRGVSCLLVTLGSDGAILFKHQTNDKENLMISQQFSARQVEAIDTTAAGDVFNGVFCACLAAGKTQQHAIEIAMIGAAISVGRKGAIPSIPTREEIDETIHAGN